MPSLPCVEHWSISLHATVQGVGHEPGAASRRGEEGGGGEEEARR